MIKELSFMGTGTGFLTTGLLLIVVVSCKKEKVDFNAQVRPILNKNCVSCHGGVKQSGGFGLIFKEYALGETENGKTGIVPGHPEESEMIARINHEDPEQRMPPEREPLTQEEIGVLTQWVEQGAAWEDHWSYLKPEEPPVPEADAEWPRNEVDHFILHKLAGNGLIPSEEADQYDLIRRVYLDLTGLPPTVNQVDAFVNDSSENAYEKVVDALLASPRYGEHWASMWLDLARFADSKGYAQDSERLIWKYRDWVIEALNIDMPFDQFTIEQLAGDLLPNPSKHQLVATAFHRNTMGNSEGGTDNEEYRVAGVIDRVNTTWEVWQGTTMSCVQCHSHPYDPIRHEEFYRSFAFFNNTADWDAPIEYPLLKGLGEADRAKLEEVKAWIASRSSSREAHVWEKFILLNEPKWRAEDFDATEKTTHHNRAGQDFMEVYQGSSIMMKDISLENSDRIYVNYSQGGKHTGKLFVHADSITGKVIGKAVLPRTKGQSFTNVPIIVTTELKSADLFFRFESSSGDYRCLIDGFIVGEKLSGEDDAEYQRIYAEIDQLLNAPADYTVPVMAEKPKDRARATHVFVRGNWLVAGDEVSAGVPELLNRQDQAFEDRMDLARWLVSDENPLTGRVIVNRFWARLFGKGIVPTVEDFGTLGDPPSHPDLLDWLALRFSGEWGWSVKKLLKTIVMSSTYRQCAKVSAIAEEKDADNRWLSHSPRLRLSAEQVRDQALAVSGLLSNKMYGPSVMPPQPEGIWKVAFSNDEWQQSEGEDMYRRAVYTYIKRSSPFPSFLTFDGSQRETCLSRRIRTNTPLQALTTLNDPVYFEAAQALAQQLLSLEGGKKVKMKTAYRRVMGKLPDQEKSAILMTLLDETERYYQAHPAEAIELTRSENPELASLIVMTNTLMNMDEFIVKN